MHREILEWAAHKYGKNVLHVRACDADGLACYNLPIGEGIIDWSDLIDGLREVGYDGTSPWNGSTTHRRSSTCRSRSPTSKSA